MPSFHISTFGCKVNSYESEGFREDFLSRGLVEAKDGEKADYYVVNTCAVTSTGERKCLQHVRKIARENPLAKIGVVGCSSQISKERYLEIPSVVTIFGNLDKSKVVESLLSGIKSDNVKTNIRHASYDCQMIKEFPYDVKAKAFIKIQDGCDNFCSYCVIPQSRGNSRSRPSKDILEEIALLVENGYKEIVITGIDMGSYKCPVEGFGFGVLLNDILRANLHKKVRFRIGSLEESQIDNDVIEAFEYPNLTHHLHIPLQSGSAKILELMHRKYDLTSFQNIVKTLKERYTDMAFSTDVIVGFPFEGEKEFQETYDFIEQIGFMRLHVFPYSKRPNTLAATYKEQVPEPLKNERVSKLRELGDKLEGRYREKINGLMEHVLIESEEEDGTIIGYSEHYLSYRLKTDKKGLEGQVVDIVYNPFTDSYMLVD